MWPLDDAIKMWPLASHRIPSNWLRNDIIQLSVCQSIHPFASTYKLSSIQWKDRWMDMYIFLFSNFIHSHTIHVLIRLSIPFIYSSNYLTVHTPKHPFPPTCINLPIPHPFIPHNISLTFIHLLQPPHIHPSSIPLPSISHSSIYSLTSHPSIYPSFISHLSLHSSSIYQDAA